MAISVCLPLLTRNVIVEVVIQTLCECIISMECLASHRRAKHGLLLLKHPVSRGNVQNTSDNVLLLNLTRRKVGLCSYLITIAAVSIFVFGCMYSVLH